MTPLELVQSKRGVVACVVTSGTIKHQFSAAFSSMRDWNTRNGFLGVEYRFFDAKLVESGRDAVCRHALSEGYDWLLMIDADASNFPAESLARVLEDAYVTQPNAHVIGAYAQLKQPPHLPTIDTGTGKWEIHYPGQGLIPVIRTGGHFIFVKTDILRAMGAPWFRTRVPYTPVKAMKEMDNFARVTLDGRNPLMDHPEWFTLMEAAKKASAGVAPLEQNVGEDSGFCDNVRACGGQIFVDTNLVTGHVADKIIGPNDLREEMRKWEKRLYATVGVRDYE